MNLTTVKKTLDGSIEDGAITIDNATLAKLGLGDVCAALSADELSFDDASLEVEPEHVTLTGVATLVGVVGVALAITFTKAGRSSTDVELVANFERWAAPGVDWLQVPSARLTALAPAGGAAPTFELVGEASVAGVAASLSLGVGEEAQIRFAVAEIDLADLATKIGASSGTTMTDLPRLTLSGLDLAVTPATGAFTLRALSINVPWEIPVGATALSVGDISFEVDRSVADGESSWRVSLIGTTRLGSTSVTIGYRGPDDMQLVATAPSFSLGPLIQDLGGTQAAMALDLPEAILDAELTDVRMDFRPDARSVSFQAGSPIGEVYLAARPDGDDTAVVAAIRPPDSWSFSTLSDALAGLDGLDLSGTVLVLASHDLAIDGEAEVPALEGIDEIAQGLTFVAAMQTAGTGLDETLGLERLEVSAELSSDLADVVLTCAIETNIELADGIVFGELFLELRPSPTDFSLLVAGVIHAEIDGSPLVFTGGLELTPRSASLQATMAGTWVDPLGATGVAIGDAAIEIGLTYPPLVPSFGLTGELAIGDFVGAAAVQFDAADPSQTMLMVRFNRLHLVDVVDSLGGPAIAGSITPEIQRELLDIEFRDVALEIVPRDTRIGQIEFEQGIRFGGEMSFWGVEGTASVAISDRDGLTAQAQLAPVSLADGALVVSGAGSHPGPMLDIELAPLAVPRIELAGAVSLLGLSAAVAVQFSESGFRFLAVGRVFDLFECSLEARATSSGLDSDVYVKATMQNDLFAYLRDEAGKAIKATADAATADLTEAQRTLSRTQRSVRRIDTDIAAMRKTVKRERARDARSIASARATVKSAQRDVTGIDADIRAMRNTINAERARDTRNLRIAEADVAAAQQSVNSLQHQINAQKRWINTLRGQIAAKQRWYNRLAWYDKAWGWTVLSGYSAAKGAEITTAYGKIGGLEAAKGTANGVLEIAKQALRGMQAAAKTFPVEADPRMLALFTARTTALGALEAARGALSAIEATIKSFPIDADPRIVALLTARTTALGALEAAKAVLQATKEAVGGLADVAQFITDVGLGGLIDIRSASFEGYLSAAAGGRVALELSLTFMDRPHRLALAMDFHDPLDAAGDLARQLVGA